MGTSHANEEKISASPSPLRAGFRRGSVALAGGSTIPPPLQRGQNSLRSFDSPPPPIRSPAAHRDASGTHDAKSPISGRSLATSEFSFGAIGRLCLRVARRQVGLHASDSRECLPAARAPEHRLALGGIRLGIIVAEGSGKKG